MTAALRAVPDQPVDALDEDVRRYLDLQSKVEELQSEQAAIRARLAAGPVGTRETTFGVKVTVTAPARRFDAAIARRILEQRDPAALERCVSIGYDNAKIKKQLTGNELDAAMAPGSGPNVVRIS